MQIRDLAKQATTEKDQARTALVDLMIARGSYVQTTSNGNPATIESCGLGVAAARTPVGRLSQPGNVRIILGTVAGQMEVRWDAVEHARAYSVECSRDLHPREWKLVNSTTRTSLIIENLPPSEVLVFRVAAIGGSTGMSPLSNETARMAA